MRFIFFKFIYLFFKIKATECCILIGNLNRLKNTQNIITLVLPSHLSELFTDVFLFIYFYVVSLT